MRRESLNFLVNNIKLPVSASVKEAFSVAMGRLKKLGIRASETDCTVFRRSIDARKKDNILFVYSISVKTSSASPTPEALKKQDIALISTEAPVPFIGSELLSAPPIVVGTGPAGLFAALMLAENGYRPLVIERGGNVQERKRAVDRLNKLHVLDPNTNIQFGAGGAGTFSDGKLVTRINDPMTSYVLDRFVNFGADSSIKYIAKPHVGTDVLSEIVDRMLGRIEKLGGTVLYHTRFIRANANCGRVYSITTDKGDMPAGALILAVGHSARDTYESLMADSVMLEAKPFSVGMRIEHLAEDIDRAMYGDFAGDERLGHAEYALSTNTKERGVYTFCMCPGGEVVAAASEDGGVVVNGMSYNSRSGKNSNSAVVCSVFREDYGKTPMAAIDFQRRIEKSAYAAGDGKFCAPIITVGDFLDGGCKSEPLRITPTYMSGDNVRLARPESYLPGFVCESIKNALRDFDKKIKGFAARDAVLTGAETRTSAPIRILRDAEERVAVGYSNLYPAGEGAGYAGGITSAAIDGTRCALALMKKFAPK